MADKLDMAINNNVNFKAKSHIGEKINPIFYNMHNCLLYNMKFVLCLYRLMDATNRIYCYIFVGGKLVQKNDANGNTWVEEAKVFTYIKECHLKNSPKKS